MTVYEQQLRQQENTQTPPGVALQHETGYHVSTIAHSDFSTFNLLVMFEQNYRLYTPADHAVWSLLYQRQIGLVKKTAYDHFMIGLEKLGFTAQYIPDFTKVNNALQLLTGWKIYAVPGLIPSKVFFKMMVFKRFGSTTWLRKMEQLDYLEEPDMFHDTFGHIPLLTDALICSYLHRMALIAERYIDNEKIIEMIGRLYWFTVEFGLVQENKALKIYGAGILSSPGETNYCLSEEATRLPFNLERVLATSYPIDRYQEQYFVLERIEQLNDIIEELDNWFRDKESDGVFSA